MDLTSSIKLDDICCPHHPDTDLIEGYKAGDIIYPECVLVEDRIMHVESELKKYQNDICHVCAPENPLVNGSDLSTVIGTETGDVSFDDLGFAKYQKKKISYAEKRSLKAFEDMGNMADRMNIPKSILYRANDIFKKAQEGKIQKFQKYDVITASCLYMACRQEGVPRSFQEIASASKVSKKKIGRCYKHILRSLGAGGDLVTADKFTVRFCSNLGLPSLVQIAATHIARRAVELEIVSSRSPITVAAAAIYMASQASKTKKPKKEICEAAGVCESAVTQAYKFMLFYRYELFDMDFKFFTPIQQLPKY